MQVSFGYSQTQIVYNENDNLDGYFEVGYKSQIW